MTANELCIDTMDGFFGFDWSRYGMLVRRERNERGCKTAESFSELILDTTNYKVSRDSIYRIEQGRQEPTAMQFLTINMALTGSLSADELVENCLSEEWEYLLVNKSIEHGYEKEGDSDEGLHRKR